MVAEKLNAWSKKRQGTTSVVPKRMKNNAGFSPCCMYFGNFCQILAFFRNLFNPRINPTEATPALAADGLFRSFSLEIPSFSAACLAL